MNKSKIRREVNEKAEAHLPKAIKEEAEYRARDQVRKAMYEEEAKQEGETLAQEVKEHAPTSRSQVVRPGDPRLG